MKGKWPKRLRLWGKRAAICIAVTCLLHELVMGLTPLPEGLLRQQKEALRFVDRRGEPLRFELADRRYHHQRFSLDDCPEHFIHATLAAEDKRYWSHGGIDFLATLRAAKDYLAKGRVVSGASTITQQLIKVAQPRSRTIGAKLTECLQARKLESRWAKRQILEEYLNRLDYGNGCRGASTACWFYFNKPLADLSPAESALLAGLPNAPSRLNPVKHPQKARQRQHLILARMRKNGWVSRQAHSRALREKPVFTSKRSFVAAHFIDLLKRKRNLRADGVIHTTLDLRLTRHAQRVLQDNLDQLKPHNVSNGAVVVIENTTGNVVALVGSRDYFSDDAGQVNGAWARRSPGSALKPFTYLLAFENGATPATVVADVPTDFPTSTGIFTPHNYNRRFHGPVRLRLALANSLNVSTVKVLQEGGGVGALQQALQECGLTTLGQTTEHYGLGLTLGNAEARLLELANAYACLARLGEYQPFRLCEGDPQGTQRIFDRKAAWWVADILSDSNARIGSFGTHSALEFDFPVACKTGTSSDFRDNWAFGYTPKFTVGVWVGNFDGAPMQGVSGVTGAAPIMRDMVRHLNDMDESEWYSRPKGLVACHINQITGKRVSTSGKFTTEPPLEWLPADRLPPSETSADYVDGRVVLGSEYSDWLKSVDNNLFGKVALKPATEAGAQWVFPLPGTVLMLDSDLPEASSILPLRVSTPGPVQWHSRTLDCFVKDGHALARLKPGRHQITASVGDRKLTTWVEVQER